MHTDTVSIYPPAVDPLDILKARIQDGAPVSALWAAVLHWLCDVPTDPAATITLRGGQVLLRISGETTAEPFGPPAEFLDQIGLVCEALGLSPAQTAAVVSRARHRLG